jgi:hypothetical protein
MPSTLGALYVHPFQLQRVRFLAFPVDDDDLAEGRGGTLSGVGPELVGGQLDSVVISRDTWKGSWIVELLNTVCSAFSPCNRVSW